MTLGAASVLPVARGAVGLPVAPSPAARHPHHFVRSAGGCGAPARIIEGAARPDGAFQEVP